MNTVTITQMTNVTYFIYIVQINNYNSIHWDKHHEFSFFKWIQHCFITKNENYLTLKDGVGKIQTKQYPKGCGLPRITHFPNLSYILYLPLGFVSWLQKHVIVARLPFYPHCCQSKKRMIEKLKLTLKRNLSNWKIKVLNKQ